MKPAPDATLPVYLVVATLASVALLTPLWVVDYLPTHDGPQHIFGAYLYRHLHDAGTGYDRYFRHNLPITNLGFTALFAAFELLLPWRQALAAALSVIVLIWSWGFLWLCRALHPERWLMGVLGFAAALQWALYMGMFSFVLSTGVGFWVLAYALCRQSWTVSDRFKLGILLTVQALVHVFGALTSGLVLGLLVLIRPTTGQRWRELLWLLILSLPTLGIALMSRELSTITLPSAADSLTLIDRIAVPAALFFSGPGWRRWGLFALCAAGLAWAVLRVIARRATREETTLTVVSALFLAAGIVLPVDFAGWQYASPRFLPYGAMFALALLPSERLTVLPAIQRHVVNALVAVLLLANLAWQTAYSWDLWQRCADALAATEAPLKRSGSRLPIIINPDVGLNPSSMSALVPFAMPLRNIGAIFALEQGGAIPYFFAKLPSAHAHLRREEGELPAAPSQDYLTPLFTFEHVDPRERATILNYELSYGPLNEDTIISSSSPADFALASSRGFVADFQNDTTLIARFRGCPSRLHVQRQTAHPLLISFGWFPSMEPFEVMTLPAAANDPTVDLQQTPCGTIWLRVVLDVDANGALSPGDSTCAFAAPDGVFLADIKPRSATIECPLKSTL